MVQESAEESTRRSSSPTHENGQEHVNGARAHSRGSASSQAASLLAVARRIDSGSAITAVTKCRDCTLVKIDPSADTSHTSMFAILTALRMAFPFATCTAVESASSGLLQFHIILHAETDELQHAKDACRDFKAMRALRALSTGFFVGGLCAYGALLYTSVITLEAVV